MKKQDLSENQGKFSYLAIGSNLGNRTENIERAKFELQNNQIQIIKITKLNVIILIANLFFI